MKERAKELFKIIKDAQAELEVIRKECKHESTHKGWYSWRIGSFQYGTLCDVCHKFLGADKIQPELFKEKKSDGEA